MPQGRHSGARRRAVGYVRALVLVVALAAVVGVGYVAIRNLGDAVASPVCRVIETDTTFEWSPDQASNASAISAVAIQRGLPARAASIALATAMQESKVRNLDYGDRDSVGLFQQRPSQGWGTREQILDPEYATNKFYDALIKVDGYTDLDIDDAAQSVQRSADGAAYAQHEEKARTTASVLYGYSPGGMVCALGEADSPMSPEAIVDLIRKDFGWKASVNADGLVVYTAKDAQQAWTLGTWAVGRAETTGATEVRVGSRAWERAQDQSALTWTDTEESASAKLVSIRPGPAPS